MLNNKQFHFNFGYYGCCGILVFGFGNMSHGYYGIGYSGGIEYYDFGFMILGL